MKNGFTLLVKKIRGIISNSSSANGEGVLYSITTNKDQALEAQHGAVLRYLPSFSFIKDNKQQKNNSRKEQVNLNEGQKKIRHQQAPVRNLKPYKNFPQRRENDQNLRVNDDLAQCSATKDKSNNKTISTKVIRPLVSFSFIKNSIPHIYKISFMKKFVPNSGILAIALMVAGLFLNNSVIGQSQSFTNTANNGTAANQFTVPAGVTSIDVTAIGGGGAGGWPSSSNARNGGGGGALVVGSVNVTPGQVYDIVVGTGGTASSSGSNGGSGTASTIRLNGPNTLVFSASFGTGGANSGGTSGNGGTTGVGGTVTAGSNGGARNTSTDTGGPGGNSGAGSGGAPANTSANDNSGGGGGGGNAGGAGGDGGSGIVTITWTVPCPTITYTTVTNEISCFDAGDGMITVNSVSGGTPAYMYSKDNGANYQASNVFDNLIPGQYKIRVKDANGCESKSVQ